MGQRVKAPLMCNSSYLPKPLDLICSYYSSYLQHDQLQRAESKWKNNRNSKLKPIYHSQCTLTRQISDSKSGSKSDSSSSAIGMGVIVVDIKQPMLSRESIPEMTRTQYNPSLPSACHAILICQYLLVACTLQLAMCDVALNINMHCLHCLHMHGAC